MDHATCDAVTAGFLAGYTGRTRTAYETDLKLWFAWCAAEQLHPLADVKRLHVQTYVRWLEDQGRKPSTIGRRLSAIRGWYLYAEQEEILDRNPSRWVRRPRVPTESQTVSLDRMELGRFLFTAETTGRPRDHALCCLLGLNGLRVSEACGADIDMLGVDRGHTTLTIVGKGSKPATMPLVPRTARAIARAVGERTSGPILLTVDGRRLSRHAAASIVRRIANRAGLPSIHPHSLRHAFVTAALDAGVSLRDVQHAARHADPRATERYDRSRNNLDRHCAYIVAAYVAGPG